MKKNIVFSVVLLLFLLTLIIVSLGIGSKFINIGEIIDILLNKQIFSNETNPINKKIILQIRAPRILFSVIAGMSLSISGLIYQTILKNPLAEPFTLGISSGATLGAAIAIFISDYFLKYRVSIFPFALIGGCSTLLILSIVILKRNISLFTLIFIGISLSYFFNAFLTLLLSMLGNRSYEVLIWMFGSFSNPPAIPVLILYFFGFAVVFFILFISNRKLDILYLSDELAESSGINIKFERNLYLALTSVITIVTVSLCGVIGFVGLVIPHLSRLLFGSKHRDLLVSSALLGAILLLISDDFARSLLSVTSDYGKEIPIGVITSLLGAPFFIYFLIKNRTVV